MAIELSRRSFLKGSLAAAGAVAATGATASAVKGINGGRHQLATLIDINKCIGCGACVDACRDANFEKYPEAKKPFPKMYPDRVPIEDWSDDQYASDRLTPYNWLFIQEAVVEVDGEERFLTVPRRCMHCVNPPCVKLCPWGAAQQYKNGISRIDKDICLGGSKCRKVCPWQIPQRQTGAGLYLELLPAFAGNGIMTKCDRCHDRVAEGGLPACIEACPEGAQIIGPRDEIVRKAHQLAGETGGYIYGETENGGTNTLYVSPVPFEDLNKAIDKGKGRPHLEPAENTMAKANNFVLGMAIAPIAGIAAAWGKHIVADNKKKRAADTAEKGGTDHDNA